MSGYCGLDRCHDRDRHRFRPAAHRRIHFSAGDHVVDVRDHDEWLRPPHRLHDHHQTTGFPLRGYHRRPRHPDLIEPHRLSSARNARDRVGDVCDGVDALRHRHHTVTVTFNNRSLVQQFGSKAIIVVVVLIDRPATFITRSATTTRRIAVRPTAATRPRSFNFLLGGCGGVDAWFDRFLFKFAIGNPPTVGPVVLRRGRSSWPASSAGPRSGRSARSARSARSGRSRSARQDARR